MASGSNTVAKKVSCNHKIEGLNDANGIEERKQVKIFKKFCGKKQKLLNFEI